MSARAPTAGPRPAAADKSPPTWFPAGSPRSIWKAWASTDKPTGLFRIQAGGLTSPRARQGYRLWDYRCRQRAEISAILRGISTSRPCERRDPCASAVALVAYGEDWLWIAGVAVFSSFLTP